MAASIKYVCEQAKLHERSNYQPVTSNDVMIIINIGELRSQSLSQKIADAD